jgi:hypothetical protein
MAHTCGASKGVPPKVHLTYGGEASGAALLICSATEPPYTLGAHAGAHLLIDTQALLQPWGV